MAKLSVRRVCGMCVVKDIIVCKFTARCVVQDRLGVSGVAKPLHHHLLSWR